jgi:anti-sigma B factor antagonist
VDGQDYEIALSGEVDIAFGDELRTLGEAFAQSASANALVDLSGVTFIDSTGLNFLIGLRRVAQARGGSVTLRRPSPACLRLLEVSAFDQVFEVSE